MPSVTIKISLFRTERHRDRTSRNVWIVKCISVLAQGIGMQSCDRHLKTNRLKSFDCPSAPKAFNTFGAEGRNVHGKIHQRSPVFYLH
ncbi:hypothetical protein [Pseudanabaena sp. CCNP1317]|uniref:hypothetical protein n=1 Tax=Pseudanabaena sp. CCNP1317 TaxID=3110253 RepID=UPI002B2100E5|nr:hypothetical protein [Pseudanabaena sp. CCNP1317]